MKMRILDWIVAGLMLGALVLIFMTPVLASPDNETSEATSTALSNASADALSTAEALATGGSAVVNSSTRAYSVSGSGMEIRDCLATHAYLFGLWQNTHINAMCEAAGMNADGKYWAAAKLKCDTKLFKRVYGKGQKCIDAVILSAPPAVLTEDDDDDEREVRYTALEERLNAMDADRVRMDFARSANVRRYNKEQAEIELKAQSDREYAQQAIKELEEWK